MKRTARISIIVGCCVLLAISWLTAITAKTDAQKQQALIAQANAYLEDEIYILTVPVLEEAAGYDDKYTLEAEAMLKDVYLQLIEQSGFRNKYTGLLDKQMARENAAPEIFEEAARYYLEVSKETEAFEVLRSGIEKTGSEMLLDLYESTRYQFSTMRAVYQEVTAPYSGAIQVMDESGKWGLATAAGDLIIPCQYDAITSYENGRVIVREGEIISAIDPDTNRLALLHHEDAEEISCGYANDRLTLRTKAGWILATGELATGSKTFEEIGMYSGGYAPAKMGGQWGVIDQSGSEWLVPAEYDDVIRDELGRAYAQEAVFVKKNGNVILLVDGEQVGETYEDARPFADGWAAVKKNGKWGFINAAGEMKIEPQFEDALSFGQHLAAVKEGDRWGYISKYGKIVIEPNYLEVRSFHNGSAAVRSELGWQFITLTEYEEGSSL